MAIDDPLQISHILLNLESEIILNIAAARGFSGFRKNTYFQCLYASKKYMMTPAIPEDKKRIRNQPRV